MIEIFAIGGYQHIGRNMTAVKYEDEIIVLDMGLDLERYIELTEDDHNVKLMDLKKNGAIPQDGTLSKLKDQVLAIVPTHAHLDHLGAIPYLAQKYGNAKILCTPFTAAVLNRISLDDKKTIYNDIQVMNSGKTMKLSKKLKVEFIPITHSTPDTVVVVIHTPEGKVVYANDFKFDKNPLLGKNTDLNRLEELKDVKVLIMDSLYSDREGHTPGEKEVIQNLEEIFLSNRIADNTIIATTFSSHISRLNSLIGFARKIGRTPIFLGRSLSKYSFAAKDANIVDLTVDCNIVRYSSKARRMINRIRKEGLSKYFIICTGHQAEPKAILSRLLSERMIPLKKGDLIIFSSSLIPGENSAANFAELEEGLKKTGATIYKDVHVSGHASKDDHKRIIGLVEPEMIIPAHADKQRSKVIQKLYDSEKHKVILLKEGDILKL